MPPMSCLRLPVFLSALLIAAAAAAAPRVEDSLAQRAQACTLCHGKQGRAAADGYYPRLAGKPQGYLHQQLLNFREGRRLYGPMNELLAPLSDEYLAELAGYFASLDPPHAPPQAPSLPAAALARGQALATQGDAQRGLPACAACHGDTFSGRQPFVPGLLGLPRDYLNSQLGAWRSGQRRAIGPDCMARIARLLQPEEINALSQWLAAQPVPPGYRPAAPRTDALPLKCGRLP